MDNINATFSEELFFDDGLNQFVPGHSIDIDYVDPVGENNYYLWKYRSFEPQIVCMTCYTGYLVNGECGTGPPWFSYVNYICPDDNCWLIRYSDKFTINEDRLFDGQSISGQRVAEIPFYRRQDILVEMQQLTLSESAYDYFKIIDDISNQSGGLNAPPPAALVGNISSMDDENEAVLGQFVAAGVSSKTVFIEREDLGITAITPDDALRQELCMPCAYEQIYYPCMESDTRTSVKHEDWPF